MLVARAAAINYITDQLNTAEFIFSQCGGQSKTRGQKDWFPPEALREKSLSDSP